MPCPRLLDFLRVLRALSWDRVGASVNLSFSRTHGLGSPLHVFFVLSRRNGACRLRWTHRRSTVAGVPFGRSSQDSLVLVIAWDRRCWGRSVRRTLCQFTFVVSWTAPSTRHIHPEGVPDAGCPFFRTTPLGVGRLGVVAISTPMKVWTARPLVSARSLHTAPAKAVDTQRLEENEGKR